MEIHMGYFLVLVFYPEALIAPLFRHWMRLHKSRCSSCPPDRDLYCSRYAPIWRRIVLSRRALARAASI
jgi:hypothetical protein